MTIKCGHCDKYHKRVDQVKACSLQKGGRRASRKSSRYSKSRYKSKDDLSDEQSFTIYPSYNGNENIDFNA
ncbi:MAG: hypothetical protein VX754_01260, partial [Actinomycetota bacterium]|nr:hypothetical protein [Actinomycetota bacterium]